MHTSNANIFVTIDCLFISPCVNVWCRLKVSTTTGETPENWYITDNIQNIHFLHRTFSVNVISPNYLLCQSKSHYLEYSKGNITAHCSTAKSLVFPSLYLMSGEYLLTQPNVTVLIIALVSTDFCSMSFN